MTYFAPDLPSRTSRDLFEFESSAGEVAGAAAEQALFENPTTALRRLEEINESTYGRDIYAPGTQGSVVGRVEPDSPLLTAGDARARIQESGLPLTVPDDGVRQSTLDILMERKRAELERQAILAAAPKGSAPLTILAGFAASVIDPINIASAFIPVLGEARYAAMLARASGAAGRAAVRGGVGAVEGAAGAALIEPLILAASSQDQSDYDMADSLANIAFGTILGGGLHTIGGAVSDALRARAGRAVESAPVDAPLSAAAANSAAADSSPTRRAAPLDESPESVQAMMARQMEADIGATAEARARAEVLPEIAAELEGLAVGRVLDVADLKDEQSTLSRQLASIDDTFQGRAKQFQAEGLTRKRAERAARDAIAAERAGLEGRLTEAGLQLASNREMEMARQDLGEIRQGRAPARYADRVKSRAEQIRRGAKPKALAQAIQRTAREIASDAPHAVRVAALRTGIAQAMQGRPVDVEDVFRLASQPERAVDSIRSKAISRASDTEGEAISVRADETIKASRDDREQLMADTAADEQFAREVADQTGLKPDMTEADAAAEQAAIYSRAWRAAAVCSLRN